MVIFRLFLCKAEVKSRSIYIALLTIQIVTKQLHKGNFLDELYVLLSTYPEDGTPLVMLGDFNINLDKPKAADFHTLLASFDLKRVLTTATHKSGNQLDLIYTRHCSTDHVLVIPLHTSDHFLLTLNLNMVPDTTHTPPHVIFRRSLRSLSPSRLSAMVSCSLTSF